MEQCDEQPLAGGYSNVVVRAGSTVRRLSGPWTPAVHAFLRHLRTAGFGYAPEVLGIDEKGREILSFIEGNTAWWPWPTALQNDDGLRQVARMVRELQGASATFEGPGPAANPGYRVRHGDLAPWNTVWVGDRLVGLIDWDTAEPAPVGWDAAQAAWHFIPLGPAPEYRVGDFPTDAELRHRFALWCDEMDLAPADLLVAIEAVQKYERDRIATRGAAGIEPYVRFLARGDVESIDTERAWLKARAAFLLGR